MNEGESDYVHTRLASFVERRRMMASFVADSNLLNKKNVSFAPTTESKNIEVGRILGSGGFSNVKSIRGLPSFATDSDRSLQSNDSFANPRKFALKTLRNDLSRSTKKLGALDLQKEAQILSILNHKNIISIHSASSFEDDYFLVIEKLETCVDKKILEWRNILRFIKKSKMSKEEKRDQVNDILHTRLNCCLQLSSGFSYLHEENIVYRDLKPENVGLDSNGDVKIFDFGLAKELKERYKVGDNEYKLSVAGTRRYMAPEVWLQTPYGKPADVYSFALTMWEILALEKPYAKYNILDLNQKVCRKKQRPPTVKDIDKSLNQLMGLSWSHDPKERLTMNDVHGRLESYLLKKGVQMT